MIVIRPARPDDAAFFQEMLRAAADWRPGTPPRTVSHAMADPLVARYVDGWPRAGDVGVIAEQDRPVGAAWWRWFSADAPGYGFVDDATPEISAAVREGWRRQGIGERLLRDLVDQARRADVAALSLSVEPDNPAVRLYERLGFVTVGSNGGSLTMALHIA